MIHTLPNNSKRKLKLSYKIRKNTFFVHEQNPTTIERNKCKIKGDLSVIGPDNVYKDLTRFCKCWLE